PCEWGGGYNGVRLAVEEHWQGLLVQPGRDNYQRLLAYCKDLPGVHCLQQEVTSAGVEELLAAHEGPQEFDLLSVNLAGNDYWVWSAIERWQPRVVAIQYNAAYPPERRWVMKENIYYRWDGTTYYGASLASLAALADRKGYTLVGTNSTGVHAFFV